MRYFFILVSLFFLVFANASFSEIDSLDKIEILNSENTPDYIVKELVSISIVAGEASVVISSKNRSVRKQVEVMLDYYIYCTKGQFANKKETCGIDLAKRIYHPDCHGGLSSFSLKNARVQNVKAMSDTLLDSLKQLGESRTCMNHVVVPGIKTRYIAIDIKPSSISNLKKYYMAVKENPKVKRFYYPTIKGVEPSLVKDSAFHLEFERLPGA